MKWSVTLVPAVLLLSAVGSAQARGVPASIHSPRGQSDLVRLNGIPSSVGSLGPQGYTRDFLPVGPVRRDRLGRVRLRNPVPLFYGVIYEPVYVAGAEAYGERASEPQPTRSEPQKIIVEIRNTRPSASFASPSEIPVEKKAPARDDVEPPRIATVFIFQDGSRKELKDFAITQTELIDLTGGLVRRSALASLDRAATLKVNAENGVEVHFPASASD